MAFTAEFLRETPSPASWPGKVCRRTGEFDAFEFVEASDFLANETLVPGQEGVLVVLVRDGRKVLKAARYFEHGCEEPFTLNGRTLIYTDSAADLRYRARQHVRGSAGVSQLRRTLIAADLMLGAIESTGMPECVVRGSESALTRWLGANAMIGFIQCERGDVLARRLLRDTPSPLNIWTRRESRFADRMRLATHEVYGQ